MRLQLAPEEQKNLIWQEGDYFELVTGNITFTSKRQFKEYDTPNAPQITEVDFFFESNDPLFGTKELVMCLGSEVPNGPAILLLYWRGDSYCAFGIVSMVNRSWTHIQPLTTMEHYKNSAKAKEIGKQNTGQFLKLMVIGTILAVCTGGLILLVLPVLMVIPDMRRKIQELTGVKKSESQALEIMASVRALMFRIAKNADQYWPKQSSSERL